MGGFDPDMLNALISSNETDDVTGVVAAGVVKLREANRTFQNLWIM
jgi:hypothetical protein